MLYTGQLTGPGTEQEINANRMGIWCTLKVWRLEMSASISSNHEGMISAYFAQRKNRLLSIKNAGVRSLMTPFLWFLFSYSLSTFFKRICFSRLVLDVTITVVESSIRCICVFFSCFWTKKGGSNQSVGKYSNSGSARLYRRPIDWNVRRQMVPPNGIFTILKRAETFACGHRRFLPQRNQEA